MRRDAYESFADRKTREAERASIYPLVTTEDHSSRHSLETAGNDWTRRLYDGPFHLVRLTPESTPSISLVFVQSKDGNTATDHPEELGGGATDKHLIYEGLSRVAADAVLAGTTTASGEDVFFSVWHPELVALRLLLGLPRHPIQVVVTGRACIDPDASLIFNVPDVPVVVLGSAYACQVLRKAAVSRSWLHIVPMEGADVRPALRRLASDFGVRRISCIGGRYTATRFLNAGMIQDLYLTTTTREAGEPNTPFYTGDEAPALEPIVRKRGLDPHAPILFEHLRVVSRGRADFSDSCSRSATSDRR